MNLSLRNPLRLRHTLWLAALTTLALLSGCQHTPEKPSAESVAVIHGDGDHRAYRYLQLPNKMRVLLISAPGTDKAAAALDVNVGSREDPQDRPGLAHFLEHMLFLGTDKYPKADEYQEFLSRHGGDHNAFTAFEHTNFFFSVDSRYLAPTLDRFSRFFVAPQFSPEYVEREKHAVDSEYRANIQDDRHRELDVFREIVNPAHPLSKFSVGSLDTLADRPGDPVRDDLIDFYRRYYSANLMTLVVIGGESLDDLQKMVTEDFAPVPNYNRHIEPIQAPLYAPHSLPEQVQIKPMQQQRRLTLAWPLPDQRADYRGKSLEYIGNILGHEGAGSLLATLKQRGWAQALSAGQGIEYDGGSQFNVDIQLTPAGEQHVDDIVKLVYQTIHRIGDGGIVDWLYHEQQVVADQSFRFREIPDPIRDASTLAGNLQDYPPAEVIRGDYLMEHFEPKRIRALVDALTPERMAMTLIAPDVKTDRVSRYYSTPYSVGPIAPAQLQAWQQSGVDTAITLPHPNPFIAEHLKLKPLAPNASPDAKPALLQDSGGLHLWFLQDRVFRLPKAEINIEVHSPRAGDSAADAVRTELLVRMLRENLDEFSYPAALAGLNYSIDRTDRGIAITASGFDQKQYVLLDHLLGALHKPTIDAATFARVRQELRRELEDGDKRPPYRLLLSNLGDVLIKSHWSDHELLQHIDDTNPQALQDFAAQLLSRIDIDMLVYGNVVAADAHRLGTMVSTQLLSDAEPVAAPPVQILHTGSTDLRRTVASPHQDAALLWYRQAADNAKSTRAALGVSAQVIGADFYAQLRTHQQLGYIVMSSPYPLRDVPGLIFLAQSPVAGPSQLADAYRKFLQQWSQRSDAELRPLFEHHRTALARRLAEKPKNLDEADARLWQDISADYPHFDSREQLLAAINALTFEQWLALFKRDVLTPDGHAVWLAVNGRFADKPLQQGKAIDHLGHFKATHTFYSFH